jgi:hypothetical protein
MYSESAAPSRTGRRRRAHPMDDVRRTLDEQRMAPESGLSLPAKTAAPPVWSGSPCV